MFGCATAELRHPPEPETAGGFFSTLFGGDGGTHQPCVIVNDADVNASVIQAASRAVFPGSAAARTAEVHRRLRSASGWLRLASSICCDNETAAVEDHLGSMVVSSPATLEETHSNDLYTIELSRTLTDLVSIPSAVSISVAIQSIARNFNFLG